MNDTVQEPTETPSSKSRERNEVAPGYPVESRAGTGMSIADAQALVYMVSDAVQEALDDSISRATAELLREIKQLRTEVAELRQSRQQPPEPLREAQWTQARKPRPLWMVILGYRPKWW
jgi:hypothetical protein